MNALATLALLGFVPAMLVVFALVPARTAVLVSAIGGWLFLPETGFQLSGLPNYTKSFAISLAILLGSWLFAARAMRSVRWSWWDVPIVVYVVVPFCSAMSNGTGPYDGFTAVFSHFMGVFVAYWAGKAFFATRDGARALLVGIFVGGLCYVLPCLYEVRMSPMLHLKVYGFFQHDWRQMMRGGGFRPIVFTPHGLALSLWMAVATLAGFALLRTMKVRRLLGAPLPWLVGAMAVTTLLCKSFGALLLLGVGAAVLVADRRRVWLLTLVLLGPAYILARVLGSGWVESLMDDLLQYAPEDRAGSFLFRMDNEAVLIDRAWQKPWFGWTPWYFLRPIYSDDGERQILISDSMWIISLGAHGLVGLVSQFGLWMQPALRVLQQNRRSARLDDTPERTALALIVTIFLLDSVSNSFVHPAYLLATGAVLGSRTTTTNRAAEPQEVLPTESGRAAGSAALRPRRRRAAAQV